MCARRTADVPAAPPAVSFVSDDPAELLPEERLRRLAALLATGLRRLRHPPAFSPSSAAPVPPPESPPSGLELSAALDPVVPPPG